jgi:hypothetical protein
VAVSHLYTASPTLYDFCKQQNKWDEYLQLLAGAIRATPSRQTGFSPNFLMFGREVTQPIDLTFGILTANRKDKEYKTIESFHLTI